MPVHLFMQLSLMHFGLWQIFHCLKSCKNLCCICVLNRKRYKRSMFTTQLLRLRLTVHLSHGSDIVIGILEADKAIAFGFTCTFVSHHLIAKKKTKKTFI